jgi:hypothetical protein
LNIERELQRLALEREEAYENALTALRLNPPDQLRQMRAYLARQQDYRRIKRFGSPTLALAGGVSQLDCPSVEFHSDSRLDFRIKIDQWQVNCFRFHLHLPATCNIDMVRIHLNAEVARDHLGVPRCHLHIGRGAEHGQAHIPFPLISPLLVLHFLCEVIEPDLARS